MISSPSKPRVGHLLGTLETRNVNWDSMVLICNEYSIVTDTVLRYRKAYRVIHSCPPLVLGKIGTYEG